MTERERLDPEAIAQAIAALEAQRAILGDAVVDAALGPMRRQLAELEQAEREAVLTIKGERKLVTIMFADISGFTALAEALDPETVRDLMNDCFNRLVPVVEKYEGTVDKFIGDEIMALFGAPTAHENDPERALRAALEMMEQLEHWKLESGKTAELQSLISNLQLHIGINTGLVIAGGIGSDGRQEYSVMGDAVNLAARLEDASEQGEILVGPDAYRLTAPLFEFEALEAIPVKGKAEPVPVYRLMAIRAVPGKLRGIAGLQSPLVGRQTELRALQGALERLRAGQGGMVTLVGEAGLGKSRLVAELRSQVAGAPIHWIEGRCLSYGGSIVYLLWLDVLAGLLGTTAEDPPLAVREALQERVQGLCPEEFDQVYPYLARLMSLPPDSTAETRWPDIPGDQLKAGTFRAVESLLGCAARRQPLVVVCEDLHWADPTSIDLLEQLLALTDRAPLLLICIFRPQRGHHCMRICEAAVGLHADLHTDLWLAPLSAAEGRTLVGQLLQVEDLPQLLRERILDHAEGNPFYVEELVRSLIDSGAIVQDRASGRWRAIRDIAGIAIPDTLHGVLMARIDRLQEETKRILQLASVIGRIFLFRILAAISWEERKLEGKVAREVASEIGDPTLWGHILTLQREEMIRERARIPELEYIFKHHLTQEAAYNGLLKKDRRLFHRQVAETLERLFPNRIEENVGLLAYHWERAEDAERATAYLLRAGDQARLAYAHQEAIDYYRRALVFLKDACAHEQAARTLMKLGLTYHTAFDFPLAQQAYEEGLALWQRAGEGRPTTPPPPAPHALRIAWSDPLTLDPSIVYDVSSRALIDQLFSGLIALGPEMAIVPDIAQHWEDLGGQKYVFHLRDDLVWSDGTPVTAGDFEYALLRRLNPATEAHLASMLYLIKGARAFHQGEVSDPDSVGMRAINRATLELALEEPTGYAPYLLALSVPLPRHVVEAQGEAWTEVGHIVSNGPFQLESWQRGHSMVLKRNPVYHGHFSGNVRRIELSLLPSEEWADELARYEADRLDVLEITFFPPEMFAEVRQRHGAEYVSIPELSTRYIAFDVNQAPFDDARVRRAFVLSTDRETLTNITLQGYGFPATGGFLPPGMPGHSPGMGLPYDPEQARQLLAEAGYPGGSGFPVVEVLGYATPNFPLVSASLQAQWRKVLGVESSWAVAAWEAYLDRLENKPPHLASSAWIADYPDPDSFLRVAVMHMQSFTHWGNEAYDELVEKARRVRDQIERMELYQAADRILVEEAAIVPTTYGRSHLLVKPWVRNYIKSVTGRLFWKDVIIEPHELRS